MNPRRSKRFTYFILLLNALFWSIALDIAFIPISRGELAVLLIGNPLTLLYRAVNEGLIAALFILAPYFLIVWMASLISYFFLVRMVRLKPSSILPLALIVFSFPIAWTMSTYFYGSLKQLGMRKPPVQTNQQETLKLDATYRNDQYGFEFRYPASWTLNQPDYKGASSVSFDSPDLEGTMLFEQGTRIEKGAFIVVSFVETDEQSSEWSLKARMERVKREREPRLKEILIDGESAIFSQYLTSATVNIGIPTESPSKFLFFDISLHTTNNEEDEMRFLNVFEQIVSTAKFPSLSSSKQKTPGFTISQQQAVSGNEGTMSMEQYVNSQYGYRVKYPSYLTPNDVEDDLTLSFMSFEGPTENFEGSFSIVVNDTTIEKQVELEKWKASHAIMESVKEKQIVKDGYSGVRLDFVPRPDVGKPSSIVVLHNGKYSYIVAAETTHIDEILSTFKLLPFPYFGDAQRTTDIGMLQGALEQYRADRGTYPNTLQDLVPSYVVKLPQDPASQTQYLYHVSATKLDYSLSAQLDDGTTLTREAPK